MEVSNSNIKKILILSQQKAFLILWKMETLYFIKRKLFVESITYPNQQLT